MQFLLCESGLTNYSRRDNGYLTGFLVVLISFYRDSEPDKSTGKSTSSERFNVLLKTEEISRAIKSE